MTNDEELLHRRIRKLERENGLLHQRVDRLERERGLVDVKRRQVETTLRRVVADLNRTREAARQAVRMIEQRVVARTVELTRDNDALREARDEAERASAARSHYIASVSHELRTPLNAIIGFSELLREELNDDSGDALISDLSRLHQTAIHLLTLINDLLDFSRLEAGHVTPMIDAFDVGDVVGEVGEMMTPLAEKNRNELSIGGRELAGPLLSDRVKLRQILLNLMANAAKFTQRGEISLTARRRATVIEFAVRDTGIGIDPARFDRLFSPFAQLTTAGASHPGGTGLGLAICHQFCQMLGGELAVESELGAGSTFTLYLPHAPPKPAAFARARGDDGSSRAGDAPRIDAVVLVVDDDDHARADVDRALTDVGAHVLTAGTFD
ncbi:MAG: hypothetical protein KC636_12070, partial [Myxococcales bacterium]|nr:hypothetical protein [Myxococcales bacterium]